MTTTAIERRPALSDLIPLRDLVAEVKAGYVQVREHPTLPLLIYTYTRACQYEQRWNAVTTRCRGLITEAPSGLVVGWCLPKFFNAAQHGTNDFAPQLPDEPFEVFEKVDGSLGIVFHYSGAWHVASKGSFTSEQAAFAQRWIDSCDTSRLDPAVTYLVEIVYPENRIVVHYSRPDLVLLAAFDSAGHEIPWRDLLSSDAWWNVGSFARSWLAPPLPDLLRLADENRHLTGAAATGTDAEGWVLRYASGLRVKIKFAEYVRLHRHLTGTTARDVWRAYGAERFAQLDPLRLSRVIGTSTAEAKALASIPGGALASLLQNVPDEFDQWVRATVNRLDEDFIHLTDAISHNFVAATRAAYLFTEPNPRARFAGAVDEITTDPVVRSGLFLLYDSRDIGPHCWRAIRPESSNPFRHDEEN